MKKEQLIKWALIAAAAYLVYRYVLKDGLLDQLLGTGARPVTPSPGEFPAAPPQVTPPVTQPPAQPPPPVQVSDADLAAAASGQTGEALARVLVSGVKLTSDQWNYYRAMGGGSVPNVDLFPEGNRGYLMTLQEYLQARLSRGLTGLGGLAGIRDLAAMVAVNPWIV